MFWILLFIIAIGVVVGFSLMTIRLTFLEVVHAAVDSEVTLLKIKLHAMFKCGQTNILSSQVLLGTAARTSYFCV